MTTTSVTERVLARVPVGMRTNPFEVFVAALGLLSGPLYIFGIAQSTALSEYLPQPATQVWGALQLTYSVCMIRGLLAMVDIGGVVSMLGRAVALYRLGLRLLIGACLLYAPAVMYYRGWAGLAAALPYFGLALAGALRLLVLRASVKRTPGWHT